MCRFIPSENFGKALVYRGYTNGPFAWNRLNFSCHDSNAAVSQVSGHFTGKHRHRELHSTASMLLINLSVNITHHTFTIFDFFRPKLAVKDWHLFYLSLFDKKEQVWNFSAKTTFPLIGFIDIYFTKVTPSICVIDMTA